MTLDPRPSDRELIRRLDEYEDLERRAKARAPRANGVVLGPNSPLIKNRKPKAPRIERALPTDADFRAIAPGTLQAPAWGLDGRIRPGAIGEKLTNGLRLVLPLAPRTKKNGGRGGFGGIRQRTAYRRFRDQVIDMVAGLKAHLGLPLPDVEYNIAAVFYVDRAGEPADKCGLEQGLYDALENAGVVSDDWYFRTSDGSRIVFGDDHPRVELTITTLSQE